MEFMNRSGQQPAAPAAAPVQRPAHTGGKKQRGKALRVVSAFLLVSVGLLVAALAVYVATSASKSEDEYLNKDKFQAVFLNGGQVYFGKIRELNDKFLTLDNIYYLRVNEQVQPDANAGENAQQDISLAKLGCELHGPEDSMVINRSQVTFWENLKEDGQVTKAIAEFVRQNPDGQKCKTTQS
ncbi:MAG: hypothetical protein WAQ57_02595 [Candidatus Saccharimonadales bacterium]